MLLIKNGHIVSPENNLDGVFDILIEFAQERSLMEKYKDNAPIDRQNWYRQLYRRKYGEYPV